MSVTNKKITQLTIKPTPVGADIITILDSQTSDPAFQNKGATLNSIADTIWSRDAGSGFIFPINLTDNVGIGTNTPTEKLDVSGNLKVSGTINLSSNKILNVSDPISAQDAATKNYVDNFIHGLKWKDPVRVASTVNLTLSGEQTVDGVTTSNDPILVKNQTDMSQNGIYNTASGAWTRATDFDENDEILNGAMWVSEGNTNADQGFVCVTDEPIIIGTTPLTFVQFSGLGQIIAGTNLTKSANTMNFDPTGGIDMLNESMTNLVTLNSHNIPVGTSTFTVMANKLSVFSSTTSSELASVISDETGTDNLVFSSSPTLNTPTLSGITKFGTSEIIPLTRTLPITVNDVVQIGDFTLTNGTSMFSIDVIVPSSGFSISKAYMIPVHFNQTNAIWAILLPISSTEHFAGNNFELEIRVNNAIISFRIRRTGGSTAGTAQIKIVRTGVIGDVFTPSTATSTESIPPAIFKSTALTQVKSNVGINITAPTEALDIFGNIKVSGNLNVGGTNNIQGTAPAYALKTYNINDLVTESNITYRCIVAITTPEAFASSKWHSLESTVVLNTKGDLLSFNESATGILPVGTNDQILTADSTLPFGIHWHTPPYLTSPLTNKGDLLGFDTQDNKIPVGSDGQVLVANSVTALGLNWINPALEEIGRLELATGVVTMTVLLSKQKKNLFVKFLIIPAISFLAQMRFNEDTSATISESIFDDYTTVTSQINDNDIQISDVSGESEPMTGVIHITNIPTQVKQGIVLKAGTNGSTAGTVPTTKTNMFKWTNTVNGIGTIQFTSSSASVSYGVGSYIIVYGFD